MPLMVHGLITPDNRGITDITVTETPIEVPVDRVAIYALANVGLYRNLEMVSGWGFLWNGVRDRNLLDDQFSGAILYSGTNINKKGENDRRTSSLIASFDPEDIVIGLGSTVTGSIKGAVVPLASAFERLIDTAMEWLKVNG